MSETVRGILVAHGHLADAMLAAVEGIAGTTDGLSSLNNEDMTPESLARRLQEMAGDGPTIVFVDLPSGSCALAARRLKLGRPDVAIVCGVNLPLLLDFVFHRELPLRAILERLRSHVGISIEDSDDADPSLSRR